MDIKGYWRILEGTKAMLVGSLEGTMIYREEHCIAYGGHVGQVKDTRYSVKYIKLHMGDM